MANVANVPNLPKMRIYSHSGGIAGTNCYLVADETAKVAVLFDAPDHTSGPLLDEAQKQSWQIIGLWLTHGHFDHTADHAEVTSRFPRAKVLIHPLDELKLQNPRAMTELFGLPFEIPPRDADGYVQDGERLQIGGLELEVVHTPGHAPGHVCYHFPREGILIGGDLIMMHSVGRTDLPDSSPDDLLESIRRVMKLPPETRLLPGHGDPSTLAEEMKMNLWVAEALEGV